MLSRRAQLQSASITVRTTRLSVEAEQAPEPELEPPSGERQPWFGRLRRRGRGLGARLASCFLLTCASILVVGSDGGALGTIIWLSDGLMLAYLLLTPRRRWLAYLCAGMAGMAVGSALIHETWRTNLFYNCLNLIELLIGALLLRGKSARLPNFSDRTYLFRFVAFGVLAGPLAAAVVNAGFQQMVSHAAPLPVLMGWLRSDSLGIAVTCPIFVAIFRAKRHSISNFRHSWGYLLLLVGVTIGVFAQNRAPLLFLIYPALILVLLRLGLGWAAACSLFVALAGGWLSLRGFGPMAAFPDIPITRRSLVLQLFVATGVFMIYFISEVLDSRKSVERRLASIASLHTLVSENSRDAIILADFSGHRSYISPAIEGLLGWSTEEFARFRLLELTHPDDRSRLATAISSLRTGTEGRMVECRVLTSGGEYIWIESSLRTVHNPKTGAPSGFLNIVRDATERKKVERSREFHHSLVRAIQDVAPEGILVVDQDQNVVTLNRKFFEVWKIPLEDPAVDPVQAAINAPDRFLLENAQRVKDTEGFLGRVRQLYAQPDENDQSEIELADGRTLERFSSSLRGESGAYLGRVWFFRDVSESKIARAKLLNAYQTVEAMAATDALTGLANRRRFDEVLIHEWRRGLRDQRPVALLMIDADRFKLYNDTYGHQKGDSCLKQIADAIQSVVGRPGDLVARFGGEEIAAILPGTDAAGALRVAMEICAAMRRRQLPHSANPAGIVTVSVGSAAAVPAFGQGASGLVELADAALYKAKHLGRDQACDSNFSDDDPMNLEFRRRAASGERGNA